MGRGFSQGLATAWFNQQRLRTVPHKSQLQRLNFDLTTQEQFFSIKYRGDEFSDPLVVVFTINTGGKIRIVTDRRVFFKGIIRKERREAARRGLANEERFFKKIAVRDAKTPQWFIGAFQASKALDSKGVDAIAHIKVPTVPGVVKVPIQIKSSDSGAEHYHLKHHDKVAAGIIILVVSNQMTDVQLRNTLLATLRGIRKTKTDPYKEFWEQITTQ
jgi:hypothetical protein